MLRSAVLRVFDLRRAIVYQFRAVIATSVRYDAGVKKNAVEGSTAQDVMAMVLMTQYFDTMREVGISGKSATILLPSSPGTVNDLMTQILAGFQAAKTQ